MRLELGEQGCFQSMFLQPLSSVACIRKGRQPPSFLGSSRLSGEGRLDFQKNYSGSLNPYGKHGCSSNMSCHPRWSQRCLQPHHLHPSFPTAPSELPFTFSAGIVEWRHDPKIFFKSNRHCGPAPGHFPLERYRAAKRIVVFAGNGPSIELNDGSIWGSSVNSDAASRRPRLAFL